VDEQLVSVATAPNEPIARMWADALGEAGIRVLVRPLGPGLGAWASAATFEHDLSVLAPDAERAWRLLAELVGGDPEAEIEDQIEDG
jgi:hypothetical protein